MIRAVVFDFDGVLADSEPIHLATLSEVLSDIGVRIDRRDYFARYLGLDDAGVFRTVSNERGLHLDDAAISALIARKAELFDDLIAREDVLFPGARACIERLAAAFPLGIASGALRHEIENVLRGARLDRHFRFIVAAGETPNSKPYPDPYRRAAELHGAAPAQCVAIEDSRWGIESATVAGLKCVGITHTYPASELTAADRIIGSLDEFTADLIAAL